MNLKEALHEMMDKIKEQNLNKDQLESYHSHLTLLKPILREELATLKKERARFMLDREPGESLGGRQIAWDASERGQRKFDIENYIGSVKDLIENVKAKLYNTY